MRMFAFQRSSESGQWQDMSAIGKSQSLVQGLRDLGDAARGPRDLSEAARCSGVRGRCGRVRGPYAGEDAPRPRAPLRQPVAPLVRPTSRALDSGGGAKGPTWICAMRGSHEPQAERCGPDRYRATRHYLCDLLRASAHTHAHAAAESDTDAEADAIANAIATATVE